MRVKSVLHRLAQAEREARRQGLSASRGSDSPDWRYATDAELEQLLAALDCGDEAEQLRLVEVVRAREAEGGDPPEQHAFVPVADGPIVRLAFLGSLGEPEPEPEPDLLPRLEEEARERQLAGLKKGDQPPVSPETDEGRSDEIAAMLERRQAEQETDRARRLAKAERMRQPRPEPCEAARLMEVEF